MGWKVPSLMRIMVKKEEHQTGAKCEKILFVISLQLNSVISSVIIPSLLHMLHYMNVAAAYLMNPFVNKIVTYSLASNNKEKT